MFENRLRAVLEIGNELLLLFASIAMQESMRLDYSEGTRSNQNIFILIAIGLLIFFNVVIISYQLIDGSCKKCYLKKLEEKRLENLALYIK